MTLQDEAEAILQSDEERLPRQVCAWCGIVIRGGPPHPISHGMCAECAEKMNAELDAEGVPR